MTTGAAISVRYRTRRRLFLKEGASGNDKASSRAGLTPDGKDNAVGHSAAKGAAVVGTVAAVGGAGGAVAGAFQEKPNMTYRHFVQRCLSEKGLDVIGWN